jgi:hypothetical protein
VPETHTYDYAVIRVVPSIERGEFINCGVILYARTLKFLGARIHLDEVRLSALDPAVDVAQAKALLDVIPGICAGADHAGPIAKLTQSERFNWLVAPRSSVIQMSPVHTGITSDAPQSLSRLMRSMVPGSDSA